MSSTSPFAWFRPFIVLAFLAWGLLSLAGNPAGAAVAAQSYAPKVERTFGDIVEEKLLASEFGNALSTIDTYDPSK